MGSAKTTLNGGSADLMPVCIGDAQINYFFLFKTGKTAVLPRFIYEVTQSPLVSPLGLASIKFAEAALHSSGEMTQ